MKRNLVRIRLEQRWKVVGALCNPKGRQIQRNSPGWITNVVLQLNSEIFIFQYPTSASSVEYTVQLQRLSMKSSIRGIGYWSGIFISFNFR